MTLPIAKGEGVELARGEILRRVPWSRLDELAAATPATRDRFMDFLRAASIVAVVFGHWFISVIVWDHGVIRTVSAVGLSSGLWFGTWIFQVMPIFFFVGGFSNLVTYDSYRRRGESTGAFVWSRVSRLLRPSLVFLGVWTVVQIGLHIFDIGAPTAPRLWGSTTLLRGMKPPGATLPFGPLWFLGVYLIVVAVSPALIALHRRFGWWVPAVMVAGTVVADFVGFGTGVWAWRWFNVAFVLLLPHQLGFFYADGRLQRLPEMGVLGDGAGWPGGPVPAHHPAGVPGVRRRAASMVPRHWVLPEEPARDGRGARLERLSTDGGFMVQAIWSLGAVLLLRPVLSRWLRRPGPWKVTIYLNSVIMTLFLWHMTAFLLAILLLWPFGVATRPTPPRSGGWSGWCGRSSPRPSCSGWWRSSGASSGPGPGSPVHGGVRSAGGGGLTGAGAGLAAHSLRPRLGQAVGPERGLGDVRRRAALGGTRRVLGLLVGGQQEDDHPGGRGEDPPGRLQAVDPRQVHVHQDEVGIELVRRVDRGLAGLHLADHLEPVGGLHHHPGRHPEGSLVVDDEDADGRCHAGLIVDHGVGGCRHASSVRLWRGFDKGARTPPSRRTALPIGCRPEGGRNGR